MAIRGNSAIDLWKVRGRGTPSRSRALRRRNYPVAPTTLTTTITTTTAITIVTAISTATVTATCIYTSTSINTGTSTSMSTSVIVGYSMHIPWKNDKKKSKL